MKHKAIDTRNILAYIAVIDVFYVGAGVDMATTGQIITYLIPAMVCLAILGIMKCCDVAKENKRRRHHRLKMMQQKRNRRQFVQYFGLDEAA